MIKASVVIATFRRLKLALKLAEDIHKYENRVEIIIVDQEQTEKHKIPSYVKYLNLPVAGFSQAKNRGIKEARGKIVIIFDDDVTIYNNTISSHLAQYKNQSVVAVAGRVIDRRDKIPKDCEVETGKVGRLGLKLTMKFWSTKKQYVDFLLSGNMSTKKEIFLKAGYFDKKFPPPLSAFDELDFSARIKKYGKIIFCPKAKVYHQKVGFGGTRINDQKQWWNLYYQSYGRYLAKNIPFPLSIFSMILKTKNVIREARFSLIKFYQGYFDYFIYG